MARKGEVGGDSGEQARNEGASSSRSGRGSRGAEAHGGKRGDAFGVNAGSETASSGDESETGEGGWQQARVRATEVAQELSDELMASIDLKGRAERNPYGVLAAGVGIGFVLGGGLFSRFTGRIVGTGVRMALLAAMPVVQKQLWAAALGRLDEAQDVSASDEDDDSGAEPGTETASPEAT